MNLPAHQTLDHAAIEHLIPHQGRMCLLDHLVSWSKETIECVATSHRAADHPLRTASGLLAPCAIEYAAQAMALHGALIAPAEGGARPGYLASVRHVRFTVARLDDIEGALRVKATRLAGDVNQILYQFAVHDDRGALLAEGRATVVLNTPLAAFVPTTETPA